MDFGVTLRALCGGFLEQYFEYGPRIQQKRAFTAPERRRQSTPYRLLVHPATSLPNLMEHAGSHDS